MTLVSLAAIVTLTAAARPPMGTPGFSPASGRGEAGEARLEYLFNLTTPYDRVTIAWPQLAWDPQGRELLLVSPRGVHVFNESGVETYSYRDGGEMGSVSRAVPLLGGDQLLLTRRGGEFELLRVDFRGQLVGPFAIKNLPHELQDFGYGELRRVGSRLYVLDSKHLRALWTDLEGAYLGSVDFQEKLASGGAASESDLEPRGFAVDGRGNVYIGFPMLFQVAIVSPDGAVRWFGQKGSVAGKFNVISGVAVDDDGYVYVSDVLKSAVQVFNPELRYVGMTSGINAPGDLTCADGKLYVTQGGKAGVAVYRIVRRDRDRQGRRRPPRSRVLRRRTRRASLRRAPEVACAH